jgi:hypothetical protein
MVKWSTPFSSLLAGSLLPAGYFVNVPPIADEYEPDSALGSGTGWELVDTLFRIVH